MSIKTFVKHEPLYHLKDTLRYALYVITHPLDGFWDLTHEKRGSVAAANVIIVMTFLTLNLEASVYQFYVHGS